MKVTVKVARCVSETGGKLLLALAWHGLSSVRAVFLQLKIKGQLKIQLSISKTISSSAAGVGSIAPNGRLSTNSGKCQFIDNLSRCTSKDTYRINLFRSPGVYGHAL